MNGPARSSTVTLAALVVGGAVLALLLSCLGMIAPLQTLWSLGTGWVTYPLENAGAIAVEWNAVAVTVLALGIFTALAHVLLSRCRKMSAEEGARRSLPLRRTLGITIAVVFAFVGGLSTVGIAHQIAWMATADEELVNSNASYRTWQLVTGRNHLKQIGLGVHFYHDAEHSFPASVADREDGRLLHSWQTLMLPYIDKAALYGRIDIARPWDDPANREAMGEIVPEYLSPRHQTETDRNSNGYALSHYTGNIRVLPPGRSLSFDDVTDGLAYTILAGEVGAGFKPWGDPTNLRDPALGLRVSPATFGFSETDATNLLMADGRVHAVGPRIDPAILRALATPDGGEPAPVDWGRREGGRR